MFAACWFAAWEFDERNESFPQEKSAHKPKCMPSIHGLWLRTLALVIYTISPALVDIQNSEKWFIVNTSVQSFKEVWESVASCSFYHQGHPLPRAKVLPGLSGPSAICAKGNHWISRGHSIPTLGVPFFTVLLAATYYSKTTTRNETDLLWNFAVWWMVLGCRTTSPKQRLSFLKGN